MLAGLRRRLTPHRRLISRLLVVAVVVAVGSEIAPHVPRDSDFEFALGPDHGDIVEIQVAYVRDGEVFHNVRFNYPMGAPEVLVHRVSLPSGDYEVNVELVHTGDRVDHIVRRFVSPTEGRLRLLLLGPAK